MKILKEEKKNNTTYWKEIGLCVVKWADNSFLLGTGQLTTEIASFLLKIIKKEHSPIMWDIDWTPFYSKQDNILWVMDNNGQKLFIPQVLSVDYTFGIIEAEIKIKCNYDPFKPRVVIDDGWDYYRRTAEGKIRKDFFNGENARLMHISDQTKTLMFQKTFYFDYLKTNLSLDASIASYGSLRKLINKNGTLEELDGSILANATGINGLIFSNDGYMIVQKRKDIVLIRPGEICSGFSGTVDFIDINHVNEAGGTLDKLDILREMVEELGVNRDEIKSRKFLGITRELIRGGTPEIFYSVDLNLSGEEILSRIPKDKEGLIKKIQLGTFACSELTCGAELEDYFWEFVKTIKTDFGGTLSVPFLTNLILWYKSNCPTQVGASILNEG